MRITFLGTSGGKPTKNRNCSAVAIRFDNQKNWYLFDAAEGTQRRLLQAGLKLSGLEAIFITHLHGDHCFGLPGILTTRMLDKIETPLKVFAPQGLKNMVASWVDISKDHLGYELEWITLSPEYEINFKEFSLKAIPMLHSIECYGFYIKTKQKSVLDSESLQKDGLPFGPLFGKIKEGKEVIYNGRRYLPSAYLKELERIRLIIAGDNADAEIMGESLKDLDLLIHECTYTQETYDSLEEKFLHTTATALGRVCKKWGVKNLIATHISPRYKDTAPLLKELRESFGKEPFIASDLQTYILKKESKEPSLYLCEPSDR